MSMIGNVLILLAGLAVYGGYGLPGLGYLLAATAVSYALGFGIVRHKWLLWVSVGLNALALLTVKLQPLTGWELLAPMGISYFTLQIIACHVDISRGKYPPVRNFLRYALHITYFPHIIIGPIESWPSMDRALQERKISWDGISFGAARAVWGLFKKFVIAARAGVVVGTISADPEAFRGAYALAAVLLYSVQLYADFSGGIDMVLGLSRILGLRLSENFDVPYSSRSVQEFWRRWHITLGAWLREYIYIPLGGNRKGKFRKLLNTLITFLVSGLWHGIHYILWGLLNGIFVCIGEKLRTKWKWADQLGTFLVISLLWAFFVWQDTATALKMTGSIFTTFNYGAFFGSLSQLGLVLSDWILLGLGTAVLWLADRLRLPLHKRFDALCPAGRTAVVCLLGLTVLIFGMYGIGFDAAAFIYGGF